MTGKTSAGDTRFAVDPAGGVAAEPILAELERLPVVPSRRVLSAVLRVVAHHEASITPGGAPAPADPYRSAEPRASVVEKRFASDAQRAAALGLGLVRVGATSEHLFGREFHQEVWAHRDGAAHAHLRDDPDHAPGRYFIATYFTDGGVVLTWSKSAPNTASAPPRLISRSGTEDLAADLASHLDVVRAEIAKGRRFVRVEDAQTAARLARHYYRQIVALSSAQAMLAPVYLAAVVGVAVAAALLFVLGR